MDLQLVTITPFKQTLIVVPDEKARFKDLVVWNEILRKKDPLVFINPRKKWGHNGKS